MRRDAKAGNDLGLPWSSEGGLDDDPEDNDQDPVADASVQILQPSSVEIQPNEEAVSDGDPNQYEMLSTRVPAPGEGNDPGPDTTLPQPNGGPDGAYGPSDPAGDDDFLRAINAGPSKDCTQLEDWAKPHKDSKMVRVRRWDRGEMSGPKVEANGWLRCQAVLTRAGIFKYDNPDGSVRRELRLPEEIFKKDSLKSFHLVPVTDDHPEPGWLDSQNAKNYACGAVDHPARAGDLMTGELLITDQTLAAKILNREKVQVSNGYFADLEMRSGEYKGERFDAIQRNIVGNHVAVVDEARAGPEARIKLDAADLPTWGDDLRLDPKK